MIRITHNVYPQERALYNTRNAEISDCKFCGEQDGESALKESSNIVVGNCLFDLRYPLWHVNGALVANCTLTENCRAAMWYDKDIAVVNSKLHGIKAMRECSNVELFDSDVISPEFGWKCSNVDASCCNISGDYAFMQCNNVWADNLTFQGKYSFQYVSNATFHNCKFNTKDAFWHSNNVTVVDSEINGQYLGWYSNKLTLIRCHITGTQPLCYCKKLTLVDCTMDGCDFSFEYSDVKATVKGYVMSIKNVRKGTVTVDSVGEVIATTDTSMPCKGKVVVLGKLPDVSFSQKVELLRNNGLNLSCGTVVRKLFSADGTKRVLLISRNDGNYQLRYERLVVLDDDELLYSSCYGTWTEDYCNKSHSVFDSESTALAEVDTQVYCN